MRTQGVASRESPETLVEALNVGVCEQRRPVSASASPEEGVRIMPQRDMRVWCGVGSSGSHRVECRRFHELGPACLVGSDVSTLATSRISPARFSHRSV